MIAYEGTNDFCFDTEVFENAAKVFSDKSQQLVDIQTDLINAINALKTTGWQSKAGDAFFDSIKQNWASDIIRYSDLLSTLTTIVREAKTEFNSVESEARSLKIDSSSF